MAVEVIGLGAGGHAKVVVEILREHPHAYRVVGFLDRDPAQWGREVLGLPVFGGDDRLPEFLHQGVRHVFIGVGSTKDASLRRHLFEHVCELGCEVVSAIHPRAVIAQSACLGRGATVMANAVINACARLAENVIVNTGAIVEHDCEIGPHAHIAVGARLCSGVRVGAGAHIGAGSTVRQQTSIGEGAVVGAGAVVLHEVAPWSVVVGVPARLLRAGAPSLAVPTGQGAR